MKWSWNKKRNALKSVVISGCVGIMCITCFTIAIRADNWAYWTGFGKRKAISSTTMKQDRNGNIIETITVASEPGKTLWDWLELLVVPGMLLFLGYSLQKQQQQRAADEAKEEILQVYFDRISTLLMDGNILEITTKVNLLTNSYTVPAHKMATSKEQEMSDVSIDILKARTLSILRRFDGDGFKKGSVIQFLIETEILKKTRLNLSNANLSNAILLNANLSDINLCRANLRNADLRNVCLRHADLRYAIFEQTDLSRANLSFANLRGAIFLGAIVRGTSFRGANLNSATFKNVKIKADFRESVLAYTDFSEADIEDNNCFSNAYLCRTILPKNITLDSNRDCKNLNIDPKTGVKNFCAKRVK